jgi:hypothetical protein
MQVGDRHHTPVALPLVVAGRYPGSRVLTRRLPKSKPSGLVARPHLLTVAGAAAELSGGRTAFPFNRGWRILPRHLLQRAFYIVHCCVAPENSGAGIDKLLLE